jgi:RHS repeat-associated protein
MLLSKKSRDVDVEKFTFLAKKHQPEQQHPGTNYTFGGTDGPQEDLAEIDGLGGLCDAGETISNTSTTVDFSYDFVYDMRSQLKQASIEKNSSPYRNAVYNYRKDGNLDSRTINSSTTSFTYAGDLMDTASGGESFDLDFDDNGNMTANDMINGTDTTLQYNWDNKLRTATKGTKSISLRYDPGGNRIRKQSIDGADQTTRKYIVDIMGDLPTTLMEIDPNIGFIVKTYIYANGQVLSRHDGDYSAPRYFYIHDRLGSTRQIINTSGSVVRYYTYEPFGEVLEEDGTLSNYIMFTGQYFDTEIDQYYLRARQYDPHISRFTARDPVFGQYKEPLTLHRYLYCGNDPVNKIDLSGLWTFYVTGTGLASFGWSVVGQAGIVIDDKGNIGVIEIVGIGAGSPAASLGVSFGWTSAETIFHLRGIGCQIGGSALTHGLEFLVGGSDEYWGVEYTWAPISAPIPAEIHGHITQTWVQETGLNWIETKEKMEDYLWEAMTGSRTWGEAYGALYLWGLLGG